MCLCQSLPLNDVLAPQTVGKNESFWRGCGTKHVKINDVEIEGCDGAPCNIRKGTDVNVTIRFTPDQGVAQLLIFSLWAGRSMVIVTAEVLPFVLACLPFLVTIKTCIQLKVVSNVSWMCLLSLRTEITGPNLVSYI